MPDVIQPAMVATAALAGLLLGGLYFGGLWWTVSRMPRSRRPLQLYFGSLTIRLTIVLTALYGVLTSSGWPQLLVALVAFTISRLILIRLIGGDALNAVPRRETV